MTPWDVTRCGNVTLRQMFLVMTRPGRNSSRPGDLPGPREGVEDRVTETHDGVDVGVHLL